MYVWTSETRKIMMEIKEYICEDGIDPNAPNNIKEKYVYLKRKLIEDTLNSDEIM